MIKHPFYIYTVLFLILFKIGNAQNITEADVNELRDSLREYYRNDRGKVIPNAKKYIKWSKIIKNEEYILEGYGTLVLMYAHVNKEDSLLYFHNEALQHCSKPYDSVRFTMDLAKYYEKKNLYIKAIKQVGLAYNIAESNKIESKIQEIDKSLDFLRYKVFDLKEEGLVVLEKEYRLEKQKGNKKRIKYIRLYLIQRLIEHNKPDEALNLIGEGLEDPNTINNHKFLFDFYLLKAKAYLLKEDVIEAKKATEIALNIVKSEKLGEELISNVNYVQAKIYSLQKKYKEQAKILEEILQKDIDYTLYQLRDYYWLLKDAYEELNDIELYKCYTREYEEVGEKIQESEKETLVLSQGLKQNITNNETEVERKDKKTLGIAVFILFIILLVVFYRNKSNQKENQKLFDILMLRIKDYEDNKVKLEEALSKQEVFSELDTVISGEKEDSVYIIDNKKINEILLKIKKLENQKYYLRQDCTLHNMAKKLKTNTSYLSKIVNTHLDKTFSAYINELRINYAILELKQNKQLRAYSTKAIAQELGYKKAASFTKYFKEATGITPAVYIKKIKEAL